MTLKTNIPLTDYPKLVTLEKFWDKFWEGLRGYEAEIDQINLSSGGELTPKEEARVSELGNKLKSTHVVIGEVQDAITRLGFTYQVWFDTSRYDPQIPVIIVYN